MASAPPRRFRFGRQVVEAEPGATLLGALARRGWPSLARSVRYHRPRGPFCGLGHCTGCLVRVNGVPNVRACRREVHDGDVVRTENSWPGPRFDLLGALDALLPQGVDTVHGLRRPAWAAPLYQWVGRRLAGFGHVPDRSAADRPPEPRTLGADVAVVGGGRSGRLVAEGLVSAGVRPVVFERRVPEPRGGSTAEPVRGAEWLGGTVATVLGRTAEPSGPAFTLLGVDGGGRGVLARTPAVVLATGGYDAALLFEGSDRPGVVTADLALSGIRLPFAETVVVGGGDRARAVLERLGRAVTAVVAFDAIAPGVASVAAEHGVPLYPRSRVVRAVGRSRLRALELSRRDGSGRFRLPCREVVLAHRRLPNAQLAFQAGAERRWLDGPAAYYPAVDPAGRTNVPGLVVVGSAAGPAGASALQVEASVAAALDRSAVVPAPPTAPTAPGELVGYYRELLREPRHGKWVLCPCEDVLLHELETAVARGYRGMELGMRYTGVGTGLCQGRYCLPEAIVLLGVLEGRPPSEVGFVTQRPPLEPTPLGALATLREPLAPEAER
jgi:sarcosine oxidase, subunit alpha